MPSSSHKTWLVALLAFSGATQVAAQRTPPADWNEFFARIAPRAAAPKLDHSCGDIVGAPRTVVLKSSGFNGSSTFTTEFHFGKPLDDVREITYLEPSAIDTIQVTVVDAICDGEMAAGPKLLIRHDNRYMLIWGSRMAYGYDPQTPYHEVNVRKDNGELEPITFVGKRFCSNRRECSGGAYMGMSRVQAYTKNQAANAAAARRSRIMGKPWPESMKQSAINRQVAIGMTPEMVREAWGAPRRIHETITAAGKEERWVYSTGTVHFASGKVAMIETTRR